VRYRVLYIDHVAKLSGAEIALSRLLPELQSDVDLHVILGEDGPLVERLSADGISVEILPMPSAARDLRKDRIKPGSVGASSIVATGDYIWRLRKRIRSLRPEVVHTNSLKAALSGGLAARLAGIPVVWHIRDRIASDYLPVTAVRSIRLASRLLPSAIVANSRSTLETLPAHRRSAVVADSVDVAPASVTDGAPLRADRPYRVGMVGRLAPWKGQNIFLEAFSRAFPSGRSEAWIVGSAMFGEDGYAGRLRDLTGRLGLEDRVVFRGFRDDVWGELAQFDTLVHCSLTPEPFGQVIIEGMSAGIPVIAADAGGPAEIITNGVDGLLTPPGDIEALAQAMRTVHDDPALRRALSTDGQKTALQYSPQRAAAQILAVYRSVKDRHR
jgi:glycosyltransferase involved in cell wall biosynthesis